MSYINILNNINDLSILLLLLSSFFYYIQLRQIKRERKLTTFETSMYILTQVAYLLWAGSYLLMILSR
ncbi:hypothetical protein D1839_05540 [Roseburia sp. 1XD42-34]|nr:hypothetical protein [Roseburia sp. 1XD42-34]RKI79840.1 hypothetical protein D7V87_05530 [Clostridium sp. 1xD42-85]